MIVVMKSDATAEQVDHMVAHITVAGHDPAGHPGGRDHRDRRHRRGARGAGRGAGTRRGGREGPAHPRPYKRASSELKAERTVVSTQGLVHRREAPWR